jgi:N-glycosylase/DNA lyase
MIIKHRSLKKPLSLSIRDVRLYYNGSKHTIKRRLKEFQSVKPDKYFYELIYCLLTPQSSAVNAAVTVGLLKKNHFQTRNLNPEGFLNNRVTYIRFHKNKTRYLLEMKNQYAVILSQLKNGSPAQELREWLVKNVKGIGYKEASHFLRNIGYKNMAILDRHILKNLVRVGVLNSLPKSLSRTNYLDIEKKFLNFSKKINIAMDELDLLFWSMETGEVLK